MIRSVLLLCMFLSGTATDAAEQYLVRMRSTVPSAAVRAVMVDRLIPVSILTAKPVDRELSADQKDALEAVGRWVVVQADAATVERLLDDPNVLDVRPNGHFALHNEPLTNDSLSDQQWALGTIAAKRAWQQATGDGVLVGVIDTGVDWEHPDLVDQLAIRQAEDVNNNGRFEPWPSTVEVDGLFGDLDGIDNDGNGYVDDVIGYDFVDQDVRNLGDDRDRDPIPFDEQGHGTSVAGVIAAKANNTIGIAGLAYDARIVTMRAFDATGNADEDDIAAAVIYGALNGVRVMNMSFGDGVDAPALHDAIRFAASMGCMMVASAGNTGGISRQYPAGYDDVFTVGATNPDDVRAPFSSTGTLVDMSAPGQGIVTTAVGGRYRTVSGTSFAAPYVVAAAAMLLQGTPALMPEEIRSILAESSRDLGDRGWDAEFGNGRLDVAAALAASGVSRVHLSYPLNESNLTINTVDSIPVVGSAFATLFDRYTVEIGKGLAPTQWQLVRTADRSVIADTLAVIPTGALDSDLYTIRLLVWLKDGRTIAAHRRIRTTTSGSLQIDSVEVVSAWQDDRQVAVVTVLTNRTSLCRVRITGTQPGAEGGTWHTDQRRYSRLHSIAVSNDPFMAAGEIQIECSDALDTARAVATASAGSQAMPTSGWTAKPGAPFAGYVLDDVRDIYDDGGEWFVMNDMSSGGFGPMLTVQRNGLQWAFQDSTSDVWIPRGMGDANGNGRLEIFGHVVGQARLFEAAVVGGNPFATVIYQSSDGRSNAAGMADIDGDGKEDLLVLSDSGVVVLTYANGGFIRMGIAVNPTPPAPGSIGNRVDEISVAAADFDGDGRMEIAFGDTDGDLIVSEFTGTGFQTEFVVENQGAGGSGYIAAADVDGDGRPDIVHGVPDDPYAGVNGEYGRQVWTYRMYSAPSPNTYQNVWTDHFYGVRYGIGYRNGVGTGQLDMEGGYEVVICAFPRMYVFRWNNGGMEPLLYQSDVVSPRFLTHDFDGNGVNELGFGVTVPDYGYMTSFNFLEYRNEPQRLPAPAGLRGVVADTTSAWLSWLPVRGASAYKVFTATSADGLFRVTDTVSQTTLRIDTLARGLGWRFRVSAVSADTQVQESLRSNIVDLNVANAQATMVQHTDTITIAELRSGPIITVRYSRPLPEHGTPPTAFRLRNADGAVLVARMVTLATDSSYVAAFEGTQQLATTWELQVDSFLDATGYPTALVTDAKVDVNTTPPPAELVLTSLTVNNRRSVTITFSDAVDGSAQFPGNYQLTPVGTVEQAIAITDREVMLMFAENPPLAALGSTYTIRAKDITTEAGMPITTGAGSAMSFVLTASGLEDVFVYPHPVRINTDAEAVFANLTQQAEIEILDQRFNAIRRLREVDGNGGASWDLRDSSGVAVPPGLYFYRVTGTTADGVAVDSGLRKVMIIR